MPQFIERKIFNYTKKLIKTSDLAQVEYLLGRIPPILSPNESKLDRKTRCTLSRLRFGYSNHLASYHHRRNNNIPDVCPSCYIRPHTTDHLFNCWVHPTSFTIESLWENPEEAAKHLQVITLPHVTGVFLGPPH